VGVFVDWAIITLIALNILAVMFETVDPIAAAFARELYLFELVSVAIFSVEYLARLWAAVEAREFEGPISGRLRFASRPLMIVDLVAIAPFYIAAVFAIDLRFMRALRLVRIFRLLKIARYSASLRSFGFVLRKQKEKLAVAAFVDVLVLVLASSAMYQLEHAAQPEQFSSIPATLSSPSSGSGCSRCRHRSSRRGSSRSCRSRTSRCCAPTVGSRSMMSTEARRPAGSIGRLVHPPS
jgi:voltage-gated potassium channel